MNDDDPVLRAKGATVTRSLQELSRSCDALKAAYRSAIPVDDVVLMERFAVADEIAGTIEAQLAALGHRLAHSVPVQGLISRTVAEVTMLNLLVVVPMHTPEYWN